MRQRTAVALTSSWSFPTKVKSGPSLKLLAFKYKQNNISRSSPCEVVSDLRSQYIAEKFEQYLAFLHSNNIAHLDFSDRNVIYNERKQQLKFIDFELSVLRRPQGFPLRSSPWYSRIPSVLVGDWPEDSSSKHFDPFAADVWSIGNMLLNELPDKVRMSLQGPENAYSSQGTQRRMHPIPGFENLLKSMMEEKPRKRPTAEQALAAFRHLLCDMIFNQTLTLGKQYFMA